MSETEEHFKRIHAMSGDLSVNYIGESMSENQIEKMCDYILRGYIYPHENVYIDDKKQILQLQADNVRLRGALEKISKVNQLRPELGQIVGSEHYEAAWLDCVDIANEALSSTSAPDLLAVVREARDILSSGSPNEEHTKDVILKLDEFLK